MVSFPATRNITFNDFKGIRKVNGISSNGQISAVECQNIEHVLNETNGEVNIRTVLGNVKINELEGFSIIRGFESVQDGVKYCFIYAESEIVGRLYRYNFVPGEFVLEIDNLTVTGEANGITMVDSAYDVFVFTNGIEYYSISIVQDNLIVELLPKYNDVAVTGLALEEQNGSLIIGCDNGIVIGSRKGDITDWDYVTPTDSNKSWYQLFSGAVTAVINYNSSLIVFTKDKNTQLYGNPSDATNFQREESARGGCFSFESWCIHDNLLFVYDDVQKNIYYYETNTVGQTAVGKTVALEVQNFFLDVEKFNIIQYIANNRNEIWINCNDKILVYNYLVSEWSERVCHAINNIFLYNNDIYSTYGSKLLKERSGNICVFDDVFYGAKYKAQIINLGSWSNLKEMELPPIVTCTQNFNNKFYIICDIDGKKTKSKLVEMNGNADSGVWADDYIDLSEGNTWDESVFAEENEAITQQLKGKFISNWYYLQFIFLTDAVGQDFCIKSLELKGITQETDTTGRA